MNDEQPSNTFACPKCSESRHSEFGYLVETDSHVCKSCGVVVSLTFWDMVRLHMYHSQDTRPNATNGDDKKMYKGTYDRRVHFMVRNY